MDNLSVTGKSENDIIKKFHDCIGVFRSVGLELQQFASNSVKLQSIINDEKLYPDDNTRDTGIVKLLGIQWDTNKDTLNIKQGELDPYANTKRGILREVHSIFDPLGIMLPVINRAKLLLNNLMNLKSLKWDDPIPDALQREWKLICVSYNKNIPIHVQRNVGEISDKYDLVVCTDASKNFVACVTYIKNITTGKMFFFAAKNKII